uniref:Uncharacterized protein n=1 Tax=Salix viminalis TaxID=40686 RepID=A0A6N2LNY2_SALVM
MELQGNGIKCNSSCSSTIFLLEVSSNPSRTHSPAYAPVECSDLPLTPYNLTPERTRSPVFVFPLNVLTSKQKHSRAIFMKMMMFLE